MLFNERSPICRPTYMRDIKVGKEEILKALWSSAQIKIFPNKELKLANKACALKTHCGP